MIIHDDYTLYSYFINLNKLLIFNFQYYYEETLFLLIFSKYREMAEGVSIIKCRASENALSEAALVAGMQKILQLALYTFGNIFL